MSVDTQSELLLIFGHRILRYSWETLPTLVGPEVLTMPPQWEQVISEARIRSAFYDEGSQNLVIDVFQYGRDVASARRGLFMLSVGTVLSFPLTTLSSTTPIALVPNTAHLDLRQCIKYILELSGNRLLFIDDASWLSSVDLEVRTIRETRVYAAFLRSE